MAPHKMLLLATVAAALGLAGWSLARVPPAQAAEALRLDLREAGDDGAAGPVTTRSPLAAGQPYVITVTGTGSIWSRAQWRQRGEGCGAAESRPLIGTRGVTGPAGLDAETVFGLPPSWLEVHVSCTSALVPFHVLDHYTGGFQINTGRGYAHVEPVGGARAVPRADHTYTYEVLGSGAPASFRYGDDPTSDNYGVFSITVRTASECAAASCETTAGRNGDQLDGPAGAPVVGTSGITLPASRTCQSRRRFRIHLRPPRGVHVARVSVRLGRRALKVRHRTSAVVDLRGLPRGAFTIRIRIVTKRGQILSGQRRYRTCTPRRRLPASTPRALP